METKKGKIKEIQKKKSRKKKKEAAAGVGLIIIGAVVAFGLTQTSILENAELSLDGTPNHDKEVTISNSIRPYRTSIGENETIKFNNNRNNPIEITFETNTIDEKIRIEVNESGYFQASKYENLPYRNYYNTKTGDTGEIVVN